MTLAVIERVSRRFFPLKPLTIYGHMLIMSTRKVTAMARPKCCRKVGCVPDRNYFKPRGIPASELEVVVLTLDEFEALRLADHQGLYQEEGARRMNVSRQTFGRIIESAHGKIADALVNGKSLKIEGGDVAVEGAKRSRCPRCRKLFDAAASTDTADLCPRCHHE